LKTPDLGAKPQVWHYWPNHFKSKIPKRWHNL